MDELIKELGELVHVTKIRTPGGFLIDWRASIGLAMDAYSGHTEETFRIDVYDTTHSLHALSGKEGLDHLKFLKEAYFIIKGAEADLAREDYTNLEAHIKALKELRGEV